MITEYKRKLAYEIIIFLILMAGLMFTVRVWILLFLMILGIFTAALRMLFLRYKAPEIVEKVYLPELPSQEIEKDILRRAFALIQIRVTEEVAALYPSAHWRWLTPNPMSAIERNEPVSVILNSAGGYRKIYVSVHNLTFKGLLFELPQRESLRSDNASDPEEAHIPEQPENYEYLAFEWVDSHLLDLNNRGNEVVGQGKNTLLIPEEELPVKESWQDICSQLTESGFSGASINAKGISVNL